MPTAFAVALRDHLAAKNLGQREFSRKANVNQGFISQILQGNRPPPMDRIGKWAEILGLDAAETERFELLAGLEHSPAPVAEFVHRLLAPKAETADASKEIPQPTPKNRRKPPNPP